MLPPAPRHANVPTADHVGVWSALGSLSARERRIIARRFVNQLALSRAAISRDLGLSKERVRHLEIRVLARLRAVIQPAG